MTSIEITFDVIHIRQAYLVNPTTPPFWRLEDKLPRVLLPPILSATEKVYRTTVLRRAALYGYRVEDASHTITLLLSHGTHANELPIQFETQEEYNRALEILENTIFEV